MSHHRLGNFVNHSHDDDLPQDSSDFVVEEKNETFDCGGCGKNGIGRRYTCTVENCKFSLHTFCAEPEDNIQHPFYHDSNFEFLAHRVEGFCSACGSSIEGNSYHCSEKQIYLHPLCVKLPFHVDFTHTGEIFTLQRNMGMFPKCYECDKHELDNGIECWSYLSDGHGSRKKEHYHVACLMEKVSNIVDINDICVGHSHGPIPFKPMLGIATSVATVNAPGLVKNIFCLVHDLASYY